MNARNEVNAIARRLGATVTATEGAVFSVDVQAPEGWVWTSTGEPIASAHDTKGRRSLVWADVLDLVSTGTKEIRS